MKRIVCFFGVVTLCVALMLPASAASGEIPFGEPTEIGENVQYEKLDVWGELKVKKNATLTVDDLCVSNKVTLEPGAVLKAETVLLGKGGGLVVCKGAQVEIGEGLRVDRESTLEVSGAIRSKEGKTVSFPSFKSFVFHPGALLDITVSSTGSFITQPEVKIDGDRVWFHTEHAYYDGKCACGAACPHNGGYTDGVCDLCQLACSHADGYVNGACPICRKACGHTGKHLTKEVAGTLEYCADCNQEICFTGQTDATASVLSEGSLAIVCAVGGLAVGMAVMFFLMRKKKTPVPANGEEAEPETDEE